MEVGALFLLSKIAFHKKAEGVRIELTGDSITASPRF